MSETDPGSGRDPVEQLLESFLARWRRGERPSPEEYAARCPERADEIRELFPALVEMEQLKPAAAGGDRPPGAAIAAGPSRRHRTPSGWATTASSASSAKGAWASSTRPSTSRSRAGWRSRSCTRGSAPTGPTCGGSARRPARRRGCTTPTSCRSSTSASRTAICYYAMQYIAGVGLNDVLDDVRRLRRGSIAAGAPGRQGEKTTAATEPSAARPRSSRAA